MSICIYHEKTEDMHDLDPRTFLIVEVKRDRPGVLGEILELPGPVPLCPAVVLVRKLPVYNDVKYKIPSGKLT